VAWLAGFATAPEAPELINAVASKTPAIERAMASFSF
jgi:hypothetical protein